MIHRAVFAEAAGMTQEEWDSKLEETWREIRMSMLHQVDALMAVGWKFEFANPGSSTDTEPWQWYWRRPPRRSGSKGMLFLSTQQAYNHLLRSKEVAA